MTTSGSRRRQAARTRTASTCSPRRTSRLPGPATTASPSARARPTSAWSASAAARVRVRARHAQPRRHRPELLPQSRPGRRRVPAPELSREDQHTDTRGSSASQVAVRFDCSASKPCTGIDLRYVKLTFDTAAGPRRRFSATRTAGLPATSRLQPGCNAPDAKSCEPNTLQTEVCYYPATADLSSYTAGHSLQSTDLPIPLLHPDSSFLYMAQQGTLKLGTI